MSFVTAERWEESTPCRVVRSMNRGTRRCDAWAPRAAAARADLERNGVEFKGATIDSGVCLQAVFEDIDGNVLILHNRYAPA